MAKTIANRSRVFHRINLDSFGLDKVGRADKKKAKEAVGEYLVGITLEKLERGLSPVSGERFRRLSPKYAKDQKGGDRTPNLELTGDMLDAFKARIGKGDTIEIGIWTKKEATKADGHLQLWGSPKYLPKRRFIPDSNQRYLRSIEKEIEKILKEFRSEKTEKKGTDYQSLYDTGIERQVDSIGDEYLENIFEEVAADIGVTLR